MSSSPLNARSGFFVALKAMRVESGDHAKELTFKQESVVSLFACDWQKVLCRAVTSTSHNWFWLIILLVHRNRCIFLCGLYWISTPAGSR